MHRVVTDTYDNHGRRLLEAGPWLMSREDAENWAEILRDMGYKAHVQRMSGDLSGGSADDDFASALAGMA